MFTKARLALVAASVAGCASMAQAEQALDADVGRLKAYGPFLELARREAPISDDTKQYFGGSAATFAYRGGGFDARAQAPRRGGRSGPPGRSGPASGRGPAKCTSNHSNFGGSGSPSGPYCFEK